MGLYNVAVVEDEKRDSDLLESFLARFSAEESIEIKHTVFANGLDFIDGYKGDFDIIFMDIQMPGIDGLDTARRIRSVDDAVSILFITNMAQYAIKGYEVSAVGFVVKPVGYFNLADKLRKAINYVESHRERTVLLPQGDGVVKLNESDIFYIEKEKNYLVYHTRKGIYRERGTMSALEDKMKGTCLVACMTGILINLRHVTKIDRKSVWVNKACLPISRRQYPAFMTAVFAYYSGGER